MKERIVENWLDKASERSFQKPFCYMLSMQGHTIIHSTRHGAMELGKDVVTLDPENTICVYQLKNASGSRISLRQWRNEINSQIIDLVTLPPIHPSINAADPRRCYFVVNGDLDEEVSRAIDDLNRDWMNRGLEYHVYVIVRGQLLRMALELEGNLLPTELSDFNLLLSFFLENGLGHLDKKKLALLFEDIFDLDDRQAFSKPECMRRISSAALLCSICLSSYSEAKNYYAEIEGWTMYIAYIFAFAEKYKMKFNEIENEYFISLSSIKDSLYDLLNELRSREHIIEGDVLTDHAILPFRINIIIGLMCLFWLWRRYDGDELDDLDDFIDFFVEKYHKKMFFWGESEIPNLLSYYWYFRKKDATPKPDFFIIHLINIICQKNKLRSKEALPNPYYQISEILPFVLNLKITPIEDSFDGCSYTLEGLVHLIARRLWKQSIKLNWHAISKINIEEFYYKYKYHFYRLRNTEGELISKVPKGRQEWSELLQIAEESRGNSLPSTIKKFPVLLLLFLIVYPHRMNSDNIRWLDNQMSKVKKIIV